MWHIYLKELLELSRDKRTLIFSVIMPTLIIPVLMLGVGAFTGSKIKKEESAELPFVIINEARIPELANHFSEDKNFRKLSPEAFDDVPEAIRNGDLRFALEVPEAGDFSAEEQIRLKLHYNGASSLARILTQRVNGVIDEINQSRQARLGRELGLSSAQVDAFREPIAIERVSTASSREKFGELFGGIATYILVLLAITGAMYPTLDLGVGEKERGTLETLLLTPVSRFRIVMAKFLVIFTTSFMTVFLTLASYLVWALLLGNVFAAAKIGEVLGTIGVTDVLLIALMLLPVTAIFASLMLSASIYAKSTKEAQSYMSPVFIIAVPLVMFAMLPGVSLDWGWAMVPVTNVALAIKELLKGTIDYQMLVVILLSTSVVASVLIAFATRWFNKESVLFRS